MKLKKVMIEAFRAYKYKADGTFDFTVDGNKPSGFISIYAPNGFGKSSFYDAVEWALTNNVSRYISDNYKKNNEVAAKGTKLDGVPQYILRNKDVDPTVETSVHVSTTEKDFSRRLNNVRVDSRDIRFNDRDTEEGTRDFRNIILSQDAIDRFVREVKPEERYDLFMEHFGGNAEAVRKKLHILSHENRSLLDELNGKHAEISLKIINEVDGNVFVEYNKTVNSLMLSGEKINQITTDFTSTQEIEIISSILSRKHQLDLEVKHYDTLIESLQQRLARVGEIGDLLLKKSKLELEVKRVGKGLEDSQKYQELIQLHQKKIGEQDVILVRLNELNQLKSELPQYIECYTALEKDLVEYNNIHLTKIEIESKFEIENINLKDIDSVIRNWQEKLQIIKELQVNASNIYVEIASARKLISSLDSDIEVLDSNRNATLATNKAKLLELTHINSLDISIDSLLSSDISSLDISDSIIFELSELRTKLTYYEGQLYGLLNVQKALTEQSSTIERLVGLGLEHISLHPTKICPLCVHEHLDDLALKNAIIDNKLASDALQSNSQMIEISIRLKEEVELRVKEILVEASYKKTQVSDSIRVTIQQLDENINKYQESRLHLEAQRLTAIGKVSSRNALVFGLEPAALEVRLDQEKEVATDILRKLEDDKNNTQKKIDGLKLEINKLVSRMAFYKTQELSIKQTPLYIKFDNFIRLNVTDVRSVPVVIDDSLSNNTIAMQAVRKDLECILESCKILQIEMESEGNWLDVEFLKTRHSTLSFELTQYDAQILPYLRGLVELVGNIEFQTEVEIKSVIKEKLATIRINLEKVNGVLASYELLETLLKALVPYVQNITRRKELTLLEVEIEKHIKVDLMLMEEMKNVTTCLEDQIRSYFYTDLINGIYRKIDPHPAFKKVKFSPKFTLGERPKLNIVILDEQDNTVSPNLYFSSAQLNILSLSVFLARAIHAKHNGKPLGVIMIDDPINSMDSINILSMIDMLRNISVQFDKQIIISTHDENFFELLQKKIPTEIFESKFITLESYGVVAKSTSPKDKAFTFFSE